MSPLVDQLVVLVRNNITLAATHILRRYGFLFRSCNGQEVSHMRHQGQSFPSKVVGLDTRPVVKRRQFRRGEPFYKDGQLIFVRSNARASIQTTRLARMPHSLPSTCGGFIPPSLTVTRIEVEPASRLFSISSFKAEAGR
jgi:hypothetical protein